uniref:Ig-like domain-containing protein n=1 Tax=Oryzias melastigma TaxID=30732 RepID=A0A3B3C608_ORYME
MESLTAVSKCLLLLMLTVIPSASIKPTDESQVGDEVTLKCENPNDFSDGCSWITWIYSQSTKQTINLFEHGKILKDVGSKSDRLSLTEKCSLVIKKITDEDAGSYNCRQFRTSGHMETEFQVELTVKNEHDVKSTWRTPKPTSKPSSASTSAAESTTTTGSVLSTFKPSTAADHVSKSGLWSLSSSRLKMKSTNKHERCQNKQ